MKWIARPNDPRVASVLVPILKGSPLSVSEISYGGHVRALARVLKAHRARLLGFLFA